MKPFKLSVINDEITQDFGRAAEVASQEFGLHYIEIRALWGKNIMRLDAGIAAASMCVDTGTACFDWSAP